MISMCQPSGVERSPVEIIGESGKMATKEEQDALEMKRHSDTRNRAIEECTQKLEWLVDQEDIDVAKWPAVLRALKDKP